MFEIILSKESFAPPAFDYCAADRAESDSIGTSTSGFSQWCCEASIVDCFDGEWHYDVIAPGDWRHHRSWFVGAAPSEIKQRAAKLLLPFLYCASKQSYAFFAELAFMVMISLGGIASVRYTDRDPRPDDRAPHDSEQLDFVDWDDDEDEVSLKSRATGSSKFRTLALNTNLAVAHNAGAITSPSPLEARMSLAHVKSFVADISITKLINGRELQACHHKPNTQEDDEMTDFRINQPSVQSISQTAKSRPERVKKKPTVRISMSDSLTALAQEIFQDANIGWLIADVNKGRTREHWLDGKRIVRLKERQELDLPSWQQIVSFYQTRPPVARAKNMVTIVESTHVDLDRVNAVLANVMGNPTNKT